MPIFHEQLGSVPTDSERLFRAIGEGVLPGDCANLHENVIVAGARIPLHQHAVEEVIVCLAGTGQCSFNGGPPEDYGAGSVLIIPPGTPHSIVNTGSGLLRQLAFFPSDRQTLWIEPAGSVR